MDVMPWESGEAGAGLGCCTIDHCLQFTNRRLPSSHGSPYNYLYCWILLNKILLTVVDQCWSAVLADLRNPLQDSKCIYPDRNIDICDIYSSNN